MDIERTLGLARRFALLVAIAVLAGCGERAPETEPAETETNTNAVSPRSPELASAQERLLVVLNEFRGRQGRGEVSRDEELADAAEYYAQLMAEKGKLGHTVGESTPSERAKRYGYDYCLVTENVGYIQTNADLSVSELATRLESGWEESPGHRENMLDPDVTEVGIGVAYDEKTKTYFGVQLFGRPADRRIDFSISNRASTTVRYTLSGRDYTLQPRVTRRHGICRPETVALQPLGTTITPSDDAEYVVSDGPSGLVVEPAG